MTHKIQIGPFRIAKEGLPYVLFLFVLSIPAWFIHPYLALVPLFLAGYVVYFFRDPEREIPEGERLILAPADGRVVAVKPFPDWRGPFGEPLTRVSIFLSVLDVHVNRAPIKAVVNTVSHSAGRFLAAWGEAASTENEQTLIHFASPDGDVWVKQIAGLIARRIVCRLQPGQKVRAGDRIGLIRFGSRVDCILPSTAELKVRLGQFVTGGSTVLGRLP